MWSLVEDGISLPAAPHGHRRSTRRTCLLERSANAMATHTSQLTTLPTRKKHRAEVYRVALFCASVAIRISRSTASLARKKLGDTRHESVFLLTSSSLDTVDNTAVLDATFKAIIFATCQTKPSMARQDFYGFCPDQVGETAYTFPLPTSHVFLYRAEQPEPRHVLLRCRLRRFSLQSPGESSSSRWSTRPRWTQGSQGTSFSQFSAACASLAICWKCVCCISFCSS